MWRMPLTVPKPDKTSAPPVRPPPNEVSLITEVYGDSPIFISDMVNLPEIHTAFELGDFVIHQNPGSFNGTWSDMGVEKKQ